MKGSGGRKIKQTDEIEYGATAGNMEGYVKNHHNSLEDIKRKWFLRPAYGMGILTREELRRK